MRHFRYFIALFLVVLCLTEASLSAPAPPKKTTKTPAVAAKKPAAAAKKPATPARPATPPARPVTPPARPASPANAADPAEGGCAKQTTCDKCVAVKGAGGKAVCGFTEAGKCVGVSTAPATSLAKTSAECKAQDARRQQAANADAEFVTAAKSEFAKIKPHVFGTEKNLKNTSGRHLASALLKPAANKNLKRTSNAATGLSQFDTSGNKKKTTWDDDLGKYTAAQVQTMCEEAIKTVLKLKNTKTLPKGTAITSVSVKSPLGMNLCISVQGNTSVFPGSTRATSTPAGQQCTPDAGVGDE